MKHLIYIILSIVWARLLPAQPYNFLTYSLDEGLPQSQVFALCQDNRGYLWAGTQGGGLSRFDGLKFKTFTTADGLPSNYIYALLADQEGRIWVGTDNGLCRFDGHRFEAIRLGAASAEVYALAQVQEKSIWIGTSRGIYSCLAGGQAANFPIPQLYTRNPYAPRGLGARPPAKTQVHRRRAGGNHWGQQAVPDAKARPAPGRPRPDPARAGRAARRP